jgi:hypothetical protein
MRSVLPARYHRVCQSNNRLGDRIDSSGLVMRAAYGLSVALTVLSVLHFYWALGGTWGLAAALGRPETDVSTGARSLAGDECCT